MLPYKEGQPIPSGYRVEERPRRGLVLTGYILTGIGYGAAVVAAAGADFENQSSWLLMPWIGPWLTLGLRDYRCKDLNQRGEQGIDTASEGADCTSDALVLTGLITDGLLQGAGGILLLIGYVATKQQLVRSDFTWHVAPSRLASGYGLVAGWAF